MSILYQMVRAAQRNGSEKYLEGNLERERRERFQVIFQIVSWSFIGVWCISSWKAGASDIIMGVFPFIDCE